MDPTSTPTPAQVSEWAAFAKETGPLWLVFLLFLIGFVCVLHILYRYMPTLFQKHFTLIDTLTATQLKICSSLDTLTEGHLRCQQSTQRDPATILPFRNQESKQ